MKKERSSGTSPFPGAVALALLAPTTLMVNAAQLVLVDAVVASKGNLIPDLLHLAGLLSLGFGVYIPGKSCFFLCFFFCILSNKKCSCPGINYSHSKTE